MKRYIILFALVIFAFQINEAKQTSPPMHSVSFNYFYSSLRPYGDWIEVESDLYAWRPFSTPRSWRPYSEGRWIWSRNGWYWDSYEPFGWATYHYGRWYYDDYYGWIWIPDTEWGPAWVEWRYDDDYIGWAPLPPYAEFRLHVGIHFSIGWHSGYNYWNFVPYHRFCYKHVDRYFINEVRVHKIFNRTKYRTNYFMDRDRIVNGGIDRSYVERKAGYRISERDVQTINDYERFNHERSMDRNKVYDYRPSEREINNSKDINRFEIKRGESRTSLERDKVIKNDGIRREIIRNDNSNRIENERNNAAREETNRRNIEEKRREERPRQEIRNESPRITPQPEIQNKRESRRQEERINSQRESSRQNNVNNSRPSVKKESRSENNSSQRKNSETKKAERRR